MEICAGAPALGNTKLIHHRQLRALCILVCISIVFLKFSSVAGMDTSHKIEPLLSRLGQMLHAFWDISLPPVGWKLTDLNRQGSLFDCAKLTYLKSWIQHYSDIFPSIQSFSMSKPTLGIQMWNERTSSEVAGSTFWCRSVQQKLWIFCQVS